MTLSLLLLIVAFICFLLAAFNVATGRVSTVALGLAAWVLSTLVGGVTIG